MPEDTNQVPFADRVDQVAGYLKEAEGVSNELIKLTGDKDAEASAQAVEKLVDLAARLAQVSLKAYAAARGLPLTHENILGLLPADIPLVAADSPPEPAPPSAT